MKFIRMGTSCPRFLEAICSRFKLEKVMGNSLVTRMAWTNTSSSSTFDPSRESMGFSCALPQSASPLRAIVVNKVFIRKMVTNKRGHYSCCKLIFVSIETLNFQDAPLRIPLAALPAQVHYV